MAGKRQSTQAGKTTPSGDAQPSVNAASGRLQLTPPSLAPALGNFLINSAKR